MDYARENGCIIVYDAAYKAFVTTDAPRSIYEIEGAKDVAIECCSYSKTAGFTGTRCGWMVIPHGVHGIGANGQPVELNHMWKRRMGSKFNGEMCIRDSRQLEKVGGYKDQRSHHAAQSQHQRLIVWIFAHKNITLFA